MLLINQKGFTLNETLASLIIILMILSISFPWLHMLKSPDYYNELAVEQFFTFLQEEINASYHIVINESSVQFSDHTNRLVMIERYNHTIRRQVDGMGQETLLQDIQDIKYQKVSNILTISLTMEGGANYKKYIFLPYNQSARTHFSLDRWFS